LLAPALTLARERMPARPEQRLDAGLGQTGMSDIARTLGHVRDPS
jgi:hypothetical protein